MIQEAPKTPWRRKAAVAHETLESVRPYGHEKEEPGAVLDACMYVGCSKADFSEEVFVAALSRVIRLKPSFITILNIEEHTGHDVCCALDLHLACWYPRRQTQNLQALAGSEVGGFAVLRTESIRWESHGRHPGQHAEKEAIAIAECFPESVPEAYDELDRTVRATLSLTIGCEAEDFDVENFAKSLRRCLKCNGAGCNAIKDCGQSGNAFRIQVNVWAESTKQPRQTAAKLFSLQGSKVMGHVIEHVEPIYARHAAY